MAGNKNLAAAKANKKDEFYTQRVDIENELKHYKHHFAGKVVYCNCDDPYESWFFKYFAMNFNVLCLKKLIATSYDGSSVAGTEINFDGPGESKAHKIIISHPIEDFNGDGAVDDDDIRIYLQKFPPEVLVSDDEYKPGDFRSRQCVELLKEADIVVTNPPFSLFREYVSQLIQYDKKFLIIGNQNAITYKEIFPLIKEDKMWLGYNNGGMSFRVPDYYEARETRYWVDEFGKKWRSLGNVVWFTNLDINKRHEPLDLYKKYNPELYPHYDNYNAIDISKVAEIPADYEGVMGVPITFLDKYCPEQFEIVEFRKGEDGKDLVYSVRERERERERGTELLHHTSEFLSVDADSWSNEQSKRYISKREKSLCKNSHSSTLIPGMIKNAEGKIGNRITYARILIRKVRII